MPKSDSDLMAWAIWKRPPQSPASRWMVRRVKVLLRAEVIRLAYVRFRNGSTTWMPFSRLASTRDRFRQRMRQMEANEAPYPSPLKR